MAKKYFKNENPIGKLITFKRSYDWFMGLLRQEDKHLVHKVTGVLKNIPANSHIKFDFVIPFNTFNTIYLEKWGTWNFTTYILLGKDCKAGELGKKLPLFLQRYRKSMAKKYKLILQPLTGIHFYSNLRGEMEPGAVSGIFFYFLQSLLLYCWLPASIF